MAWDIFVTTQVKEFLESIERADPDWYERLDDAIGHL